MWLLIMIRPAWTKGCTLLEFHKQQPNSATIPSCRSADIRWCLGLCYTTYEFLMGLHFCPSLELVPRSSECKNSNSLMSLAQQSADSAFGFLQVEDINLCYC
ncbi:hypothetical protein R1flu_013822 [Riccia fluitans]|uniref:Uncharacterized protein n=1 Tax=Riccia fluitans TaxID=41844 RepID=A0ABD1YEN6_9MARC